MSNLRVVSASKITVSSTPFILITFLDGHYVYLEMDQEDDELGRLLALTIFNDMDMVFRYASRLSEADVFIKSGFAQQTAAAYFEAAQAFLTQNDPLAPAFPRTLCEETMQLLEHMKAGELKVLPPVDFKSMYS